MDEDDDVVARIGEHVAQGSRRSRWGVVAAVVAGGGYLLLGDAGMIALAALALCFLALCWVIMSVNRTETEVYDDLGGADRHLFRRIYPRLHDAGAGVSAKRGY